MNSSRQRPIFLLIVSLLFAPSLSAAGILPTGRAEHEFVYDWLEHQQTLTLDRRDYQLGPYPFSYHDGQNGPFSSLARIEADQARLFISLSGNQFVASDSRPEEFNAVRGGLALAPSDNLYVYGNFVLDEALAEDPSYRGKKWRGFAGGVENALVHFQTRKFQLLLGRFSSYWGPRNSLIVSGANEMDGLEYRYRWGRLTLSYRMARLDGLSPERDGVDQFENRFFAAHRIDLHLSSKIRLGFFEAVVFGGPGRQFEWIYLNPLIFFHGSQLNEGFDDNTFVGFDYTFKPARGVKLYGQLMLDDFQIDNKTQGDKEPDQYGIILGAHFANLVEKFDLRAEYSRVTHWTFNQGLSRNRYLYNRKPIGGAFGNDYDYILLTLTRWHSSRLAISANFSYTRQGEGSITEPWTAPWLLATGEYSENFPTGVVEKSLEYGLGVKAFIGANLFVHVRTGLVSSKNMAHLTGENQTDAFIQINVTSFLSTLIRSGQ